MATEQQKLAGLTRREKEALSLLSLGATDSEIGRLMAISPKTVQQHVHRIRRALKIKPRVRLARFAIRNGLSKLKD